MASGSEGSDGPKVDKEEVSNEEEMLAKEEHNRWLSMLKDGALKKKKKGLFQVEEEQIEAHTNQQANNKHNKTKQHHTGCV